MRVPTAKLHDVSREKLLTFTLALAALTVSSGQGFSFNWGATILAGITLVMGVYAFRPKRSVADWSIIQRRFDALGAKASDRVKASHGLVEQPPVSSWGVGPAQVGIGFPRRRTTERLLRDLSNGRAVLARV